MELTSIGELKEIKEELGDLSNPSLLSLVELGLYNPLFMKKVNDKGIWSVDLPNGDYVFLPVTWDKKCGIPKKEYVNTLLSICAYRT